MEQVWRQTEHPGDGDGLKSAFQRVRFPINKEQNMNMREPKTMWDRAPTDAELGYTTKTDKLREFWEDEISGAFHEIKSTTGLPCITYRYGYPKKEMYAIGEVVADSIWLDSPTHKALMAVLANSKCQFVAQLKQSLIDEFVDKNVPELIEFDLGRLR